VVISAGVMFISAPAVTKFSVSHTAKDSLWDKGLVVHVITFLYEELLNSKSRIKN
jgi:hypothetical protein